MRQLPRFRILLIEDDPDDVYLFREMLESWQHPICDIELDVHRSYHTAVSSMQSGDFDLLVTDYFLSGAFQDEQASTARDFLAHVTATHKHIPIVVWTSSPRLDVDPSVIKCVLNRQVHYCAKHKFNLATLRYLIAAVQMAVLSLLVVTDQQEVAEEVDHLVRQSDFYRFSTRRVGSLEEARECIRIQAPELCLIDLPLARDEFKALSEQCEQAGTSLLVTCVSEGARGAAEGRQRQVAELAQNVVPVLTEQDLKHPLLTNKLVRQRNRIPIRSAGDPVS